MSDGIVVAIISGVLTLAGTIITVIAGMSKTSKNIEIVQAVTNEKLNSLTEEVKKHNEFGQRIPILEERINTLSQRVEQLEKGTTK